MVISFQKFVLDNGLQVVVHEDPTSLIAVVNVMYNVGSRDDNPEKTGFAHLFEHFMFEGSTHIPSYDQPLQQVGGSNNAYTSNDVTNYYCTLPAINLETAFWLESDRMLGLAFDKDALEVQKKVVIEEFKEVYLNKPYGDAWLQLTQVAYTTHPYQFPVIGKTPSHIESMTMEEVQAFFKQFYIPNNAVLVVAGGVKVEEVKGLSQKWFGPIPSGKVKAKDFPQEPLQTTPRKVTIARPVPLDAFYQAYHVPGRLDASFYAIELLCTALGIGKASRLYQGLVVEQSHFSDISAYTTATIDPGLLVIAGQVHETVSLEVAEQSVKEIIHTICSEGFTSRELEKAKNHLEADLIYHRIEVMERAEELALATLLGDSNLVNTYIDSINKVTLVELNEVAKKILEPGNCTTLHYQSEILKAKP